MANDSTTAGQVSSEQDSTPTNDSYFTDMQGEEAFFGPEQLAQAAATAGGAPVQVPVPADQNVIRVPVTPGEILELSSPFDANAALLGREENGNLAIKVGDVTVILLGYVDANSTAPVVVETSDGQPIDIATLLASTDPSIDIQTAAGPGDAAGAQGADNTGAILALLQGGTGLGGLNAVGAQDQTELSYGLIDNSIRLDREDALSAAGSLSGGGFKGLAEPFLRDPAHTNSASWFSFDDFKNEYTQYINDHQATKGGWADFTGTQAGGDTADFFLGTSFTVNVPHSSGTPQQLNLLVGPDFFNGDVPTSNGETLVAEYLGGAFGDKSTIVLVRPSDGAVIMVFHVQESESTGDFHVEVYLVNRLDHHFEGQDVLSVGFNTELFTPPAEGEESQGTTTAGPSGSVDILDDVPVAHDVEYTSYNGKDAEVDADSQDNGKTGGSHDHTDTTADGKGYVDEDWVKHGNKDHDNNPSGANSDDAHGDTIGRAIAKGNLNIDFGADGPAGADGNDCSFTLGEDSTLVLKLDTSFEAGFVDENGHVLDAQGNVVKSHDHELVILSDTIDSHGVEHLIVGYTVEHDAPTESSELVFATETESEGSCDVAVFELTLDLNPDDHSGNMHFQDFKFELFKALDQDPNAPTVESNTDLQFKVVGHDDDGDPVHTAINIQVNDDSPTFEITYRNEDPRNCDVRDDEGSEDIGTFGVSGDDVHVGHYTTKDFGHVDEDWLDSGARKEAIVFAGGQGNHDRDAFYQDNANLFGDDKGGLEVCGEIKVKYGADGPGSSTLGLDKYDEQAEGTYLTFVNGDAAHSTFTQNGVPLVVLFSSETKLVVGTAVGVDDGEGGTSFNETPVFCLELNPDTGKFDFHLLGAIDHDPTTNPDNGDPETNLVLSFNVGAAEDFDHDTAIGTINIKVNDDHPEVGISYFNNLEHDFGISEGLVHLSGAGPNDIVKTEDFGHVDEDFLKSGSQVSGLHYTGNQDEDANGTTNADKFGDDIGKTEVCGQITVNYGADGASGTDNPFGLETYTLPVLGSTGDGVADYAAYEAALPVFKNVDGSSVFSGGVELKVLSSDGGHLEVGIPGTAFRGEGGVPTFVPDQKVFEIDFNNGDGKFDFKLWGPIDHDPQAGPDGPETNSLLTFQVGSATDRDGDTVDAVIKIQVNDDSPEVGVEYTNNLGETSTTVGRVDEDWAFQSPGNQDTDATPGDTTGLGTVFFDLTVGYGGDGPGASQPIGFTAQENDTLTANDDNGDPQTVKTSDGHVVLVHVDTASAGFAVLTGYFNSDDSVGYVEGTSAKVFTLAYNQSTMDGQFNLLGSLQHPIADTEDNLLLSFGIKTGLTDADGDPAIATININVNDDGPVAADDCELEGTVSGNLLNNDPVLGTDKPGADGFRMTDGLITAVTHIKALDSSHVLVSEKDVADTGETTIQGLFGVLTLFANGNWSYELDDPDVKGSDIFAYTLTDGDGDTDSAELIVTTGVSDDSSEVAGFAALKVGPTHEPAPSYDHDVTVTGLNGIVNPFTSQTYHFEDSTGGHVVSGGAGNDYINVTGTTGAVLTGNGGDDIIHGGDGKSVLNGGSGDDTLFGGNNDDSFFGGAGHDAMSGGGGNDTFYKVDADDLDGTNTLDGVHSIDGGTGIDTVDLSGLKTFDSSQAMHLENVEALSFEGKASGGGGTVATLNYDAAYGITEVGGLHQLTISGDKADTLNLQASGGNAWHQTANADEYEAGVGAAKVTLTVDHDITVQLS